MSAATPRGEFEPISRSFPYPVRYRGHGCVAKSKVAMSLRAPCGGGAGLPRACVGDLDGRARTSANALAQFFDELIVLKRLASSNPDFAAEQFLGLLVGPIIGRLLFGRPSYFESEEHASSYIEAAVDLFLASYLTGAGWNTKSYMVAANARTAICFALSPGNEHDAPAGRALLEELGEMPKGLPLLMDRAYEGDETRQLVRISA